MKQKEKEQNEMFALNSSVLDNFSIEELEQRLETDPLAVGQLLDISTSTSVSDDGCCLFTHCNHKEG